MYSIWYMVLVQTWSHISSQVGRISNYLSINLELLTPHSPSPKGMTAEKPPLLPIQTFLPCSFKSSPTISISFMHILSLSLSFHLITSHPLLPRPSISLTYTLITNSLLFLSLNMTKPPQSISFHPLHYTTLLHLHKVPCHTFHTC